MNKKLQRTFITADFVQYCYILQDEEVREKVAGFLLKYVSLEAYYKRLLIAEMEQNGEKLTKKDRRLLGVKMNDVKRVVKYYDISVDEELLERIFGSNDSNYMDCSIKKLRDRLVHSVNDNVLRIIMERYESMNEDLDSCTQCFTTKSL